MMLQRIKIYRLPLNLKIQLMMSKKLLFMMCKNLWMKLIFWLRCKNFVETLSHDNSFDVKINDYCQN